MGLARHPMQPRAHAAAASLPALVSTAWLPVRPWVSGRATKLTARGQALEQTSLLHTQIFCSEDCCTKGHFSCQPRREWVGSGSVAAPPNSALQRRLQAAAVTPVRCWGLTREGASARGWGSPTTSTAPASLPTPCVLGGPWAWHPSRSCAISPPSRVLRHPHQGCSLRCGQLPSQGGPRTGPWHALPLISQLEEMYIALCPLVPPFSSVWGPLPACLPATGFCGPTQPI